MEEEEINFLSSVFFRIVFSNAYFQPFLIYSFASSSPSSCEVMNKAGPVRDIEAPREEGNAGIRITIIVLYEPEFVVPISR